MPSIKDFEKTMKPSERDVDTDAPVKSKKRRRPGRDHAESAEAAETEPIAELGADAADDVTPPPANEDIIAEDAHEEIEPEKPRLDFYGSELLRMKAPQAFDLAESVVDQWRKDGDFAGLPLPHPVAQMGAQVALRKAKDLEKKLEEKGVFMVARMGLEYAKAKLKK